MLRYMTQSTCAYTHSMPFGAEMLCSGAVRFRLWAPRAQRVAVCLEGRGSDSCIDMTPAGHGWFEQVCEGVSAGDLYRYRIDNDSVVPDPASRFQPKDVHGPSEVIDPTAFDWGKDEWLGRPWEEAIIYELHVGSFTPQGDFRGVEKHLDHLASLGVTAVELMPVGDFPGACNWGYDGVYPFAPDASYGRPEDLKHLVRKAHALGLMVFLDVVFNHFGPEGNYLNRYASRFFSTKHQTPWGQAINFDGEDSDRVRAFFVHNALYWLEEYRFDGLRLDAVHTIRDDSRPDILEELAAVIAAGPGARRQVHLVLENDNNAARYLTHGYRAQWNDDLHHVLHVLLTGEQDGYYIDYADRPLRRLGRCLAEGFDYQGERSTYREGRRRGETSAHLSPAAFVGFLQNHDQIGNRAFGERLGELTTPDALRAATTLVFLAPQPVLVFMGQEWGCRSAFPFFCDFGPELAASVVTGRRDEFMRFERFRDPAIRARIPDPQSPETFRAACLDWSEPQRAEGQRWLALHRELLALRRREIVPLIRRIGGHAGRWRLLREQGLEVVWRLSGGGELVLLANLTERGLSVNPPSGRRLFATHPQGELAPPWFVGWYLQESVVP